MHRTAAGRGAELSRPAAVVRCGRLPAAGSGLPELCENGADGRVAVGPRPGRHPLCLHEFAVDAVDGVLQVGVALVGVHGSVGLGLRATAGAAHRDFRRHSEQQLVVGNRELKPSELQVGDPVDDLGRGARTQARSAVGRIRRGVAVADDEVVPGEGVVQLTPCRGPVEGEEQGHRVDAVPEITVPSVQRLRGEVRGDRFAVAGERERPDRRATVDRSGFEASDDGAFARTVETFDSNQNAHADSLGSRLRHVDAARRTPSGPARQGVSHRAIRGRSDTMAGMKPRILVVDDDAALAEMLTIVLKNEGFEPFVVGDGTQALTAVREVRPDLVLLDLMLPGMNGIDVCRVLRADSGVPIVMLTAKSDTVDVVLGLESGADDYMVKPFKPKELVARIRARLRRTEDDPAELLAIGPVEIDVPAHKVTRDGVPISLTPLEFDLLVALARKPRQVFTRDVLLEQVWGYRHPADTRLVNVHVQRLRAKVEIDPENPEIVLTVRGVGYKAGPP